MRLDSIRMRNIGALKEVDLNLEDLGAARVIAVCGANGAGKSSFLEVAAVGALYRTTPTRGTLVSLATARDSYVEVQVTNGQSYRIKHLLDNVSGKSEASVTDSEGRPLFDSAKVRDFSTWAAKTLPAPEVTLSTVFAAQNSSGFLGAKPADRKSILLRALGIEALEGLAERARNHRREVNAEVDTLRARIADERSRGGDVQALEGELASARERATSAELSAIEARTILALARQQVAERTQAERDYRAAVDRHAKLKGEIEQVREQLGAVERRVANNRAVLREGDAIRGAAAELDGRRKQLSEARTGIEHQRTNVAQWSVTVTSLESQLESARRRLNQAAERVAQGDAAREAARKMPDADAAVESCTETVQEKRAELARLQSLRVAGADDRIRDLRTGLQAIARPDTSAYDKFPSGSLASEIATEVLRQDDAALELAASLPAEVRAADDAVTLATSALVDAQLERDLLRRRAAGVEAAEQAAGDVDQATAEIQRVEVELANARDELAQAHRIAEVGSDALASIESAIATLEPIAAKLSPLQNAEARLAELDPQRAQLAARLATLDQELTDTPETSRPPAAPDVSAFERDANQAESAHRKADGDVLVAEANLQRARESSERVQALEADLTTASAELADWTRLAEDLGPKGLQLTLIDSAGPEITETANDLLRECHGTRFSVRVETQRLSSDKKKLIDGCDVMVTDTESGREAAGETFSGGERVIIGEALSLALTVVACRRSGVRGVTLIRDETAGQLSPENARAYLGMLRRAADLVDASRVLFVAHDPALWEMADARIDVGHGQVKVA